MSVDNAHLGEILGNKALKSSVRIFVLAGGKGERFFPFSSLIPKCLIPVAGKPCARWIIEDALKQGFEDIILCINKKDESNFRYEFRDLKMRYSVREESSGTADELLYAKKFVDGTFILRYGDDLTEIDYEKLLEFHKKKHATVTLGSTTSLRLPVGVLEIDPDKRVTVFSEKPCLQKPSWIGIGVFEPRAMNYFRSGKDIAADTISRMINAGEGVYSFVIHNGWYDVGNLEHWRNADEYFRISKLKGVQDRIRTGCYKKDTIVAVSDEQLS